MIAPLAGVVLSAETVVDGLKHAKADAVILAPPFLEQIAKSAEMRDSITECVATVTYGGGDVSQWSGDALTQQVKLFNFNGSTETGGFPLLRPREVYPSEDWKYIQPHPAAGLEFRPTVHGLFEAYLVRDPVFENEQPVFKVFSHLQEYRTKDLWAPHSSKEGLWTYRGRADDIIVFTTSFMCDPIPMEQHVSRQQDVQAVLMSGTGRFQPALLIERTSDPSYPQVTERELTEKLWPMVQEANQSYKLDSTVSKSHIMYTSLQQPMRRAGKGTVQRGPTLALYKDAIDALYEREGDAIPGHELILRSADQRE